MGVGSSLMVCWDLGRLGACLTLVGVDLFLVRLAYINHRNKKVKNG